MPQTNQIEPEAGLDPWVYRFTAKIQEYIGELLDAPDPCYVTTSSDLPDAGEYRQGSRIYLTDQNRSATSSGVTGTGWFYEDGTGV